MNHLKHEHQKTSDLVNNYVHKKLLKTYTQEIYDVKEGIINSYAPVITH